MKALLKDREKAAAKVAAAQQQQQKTEPSPSSSAMSSPPIQQATCRVCNRSAPFVGHPDVAYTGAFVCEACKKFYCRYRGKIEQEKCTCGGNDACSDDDKCRLCRYQRCKVALVEFKAAMAASKVAQSKSRAERRNADLEKVDFCKLPCAVCGCSSSGFHFGVVSCEGCKGFFRRSMKRTYKLRYKCRGDGTNGKHCPISSNCRKCRLERCVDAGMSLKDVAVGRHTLQRRAEIEAAIKKHSDQGSFLKTKIWRRERGSKTSPRRVDSQGPASMATANETFSTPPSSLPPGSFQPPNLHVAPGDDSISRTQCPANTDQPLSSVSSGESHQSIKSASAMPPRSNDSNFGGILSNSNDWFIEKAVEAAARLSGISAYKIVVDYGVSEADFIAARIASDEAYAKCVSDFMTALPGTNNISLSDRVQLFTQALFPICAAQVSLNFDVVRQVPNHFSLDRESAAWNVSARLLNKMHFAIEDYLREAGNRFIATVANLQEFAVFCAILLLNPETPNLENPELIRCLRRRYDLAMLHLLSTSSEQRLREMNSLFPYFRQATNLFRDLFVDVNVNRSHDKAVWTPLFTHIHSEIVKLESPSPSASTPLI